MTEVIYRRGPTPVYPRISAFDYLLSSGDPDTHAFVDATTGNALTRAELKTQSLQLAHGLRHIHSLSSDDAVLIFSPNHLLYPVVQLGCFAAGIPVATASSASVAAELAHALELTKCTFFVVHPNLMPVFENTMALVGRRREDYVSVTLLMVEGSQDIPATWTRYRPLQSLIRPGKLLVPVRFDGEDANTTCLYLFSSGTTGLPKAIGLSHRAIVMQAEAIKHWDVFREGDVLASPLPLFHVAAAHLTLWSALALGGTSVTWSTFTFESFLEGLVKYKANMTGVVPPLLAGFFAHPAVPKADLRHLRCIVAGAAPISPFQLQATFERLRPIAHPDLIIGQAYGMSETCATTLHAVRPGPPNWASIGAPSPGVEVRLVREDGIDAAPGEPGELWQRGDFLMNGYLGDPQATANAITPDGWLRSGDVCVVDDKGDFYVVDRLKELIKYKGYQVPPAELEAVLMKHPSIADACVIGVPAPDGSTDELPKAFVSLRDASLIGSAALPSEIAEWVKPQVSHYKALRGGVVLVQSIPRSPSGKILRRQMREFEKHLRSQQLPPMKSAKL